MPRLTLWWENPNHAGVFLAFVATTAWTMWLAGIRHRLASAFTLIVATAAVALLCYTRSRGALVALIGAECTFLLLAGNARGLRTLPGRAALWAALLVVIGCLVFSGLGDRFATTLLLSDGSSTARLTLWRHTLSMIAFCPLQGWGAGASGEAYMNFFQPLDDTRTYGGPSSSFLHIAVEFGIPALTVAVLLFAPAVAEGRRLLAKVVGDRQRTILAACFRVVAVYLIASCFSTIWVVPSITGPALAAAAFIIATAVAHDRSLVLGRLAKCALAVVGAAAVFSFVCLGFRIAGDYQCTAVEDGCVVLRSRRPGDGPRLYLLGDPAVLGPRSARVLRGALSRLDLPVYGAVVVHERGWAKAAEAGSLAVAFGRSHQHLPPHQGDLMLVRPLSARANSSASPSLIVLPGFDDTGDFAHWRAQAEARRIALVHLRSPLLSQSAVAEALGMILHARQLRPPPSAPPHANNQ